MFSLESHTKPVWWRIKYPGGRDIPFFICNPPPPSKDDRHPNPWNFAWSLKCCLCPLKKWNLKGSFLVSTFEKFVLLSVGVQILSASFKKKKSEPPYSKPVISWGRGQIQNGTWRLWDRLVAIILYIGKIWDGRQKVKSPIVWDFSRPMESRL